MQRTQTAMLNVGQQLGVRHLVERQRGEGEGLSRTAPLSPRSVPFSPHTLHVPGRPGSAVQQHLEGRYASRPRCLATT